MNCERYKSELEDLHYGELETAREVEIRRHLSACASCRAMFAELEREQEIFSRFYEQTALDPSPEMWEAIRVAIGEQTGRSSLWERTARWLREIAAVSSLSAILRPAVVRQLAFALVLIGITAGVTTFVLRMRNDSDSRREVVVTPQETASPSTGQTPAHDLASTPQKPVETRLPDSKPEVTRRAGKITVKKQLTEEEKLNQQIARAAREYQNAIRMLDQAIAKQRGTLDPDLLKQYESSLALIDSSIAQSRRALRERPDDIAAGQFLLASYARKVELMQDIAMR